MKRLPLLIVALSSVFCLAAAPPAPELIPVVVFPPVAGKNAPEGFALAMQQKANALLLATGPFAVIHPRQVASMAARHRMKLEQLGDPNAARLAAERLGVKLFVWGTLKPFKDGWTLELSSSAVGEPGALAQSVTLAKGEAQAIWDGAQALAVAVHKQAKTSPGGAYVPEVKDPAARDWAACEAQLARQSIGVENPTMFSASELTRAVGLCGSAVKAAPKFAEAWAALALAAAISGNDERAVFALTQVNALQQPTAHHLPDATLARFWLVTRYQSTDAGEAVLREAIAREPGFLLVRGYLAELFNAEGKHADAAKAWQEYSAVTPNNPFLISRLAYTLSRLGKTAEAAAFAEKALAYDPESLELNLELASRYLDAAAWDKAIATLEPLAKPADARAEVILRLGYAKLLAGKADEAEKLFTRAYGAAKDPADWRTRGRAKLNLAVVALKKDKKPEAKKLVLEAAKEGLALKATPETKDVLALLTDAELAAAQAKPKQNAKEASPFTVSGGEVNPDAARPAAPKGFDEVKMAQDLK